MQLQNILDYKLIIVLFCQIINEKHMRPWRVLEGGTSMYLDRTALRYQNTLLYTRWFCLCVIQLNQKRFQ